MLCTYDNDKTIRLCKASGQPQGPHRQWVHLHHFRMQELTSLKVIDNQRDSEKSTFTMKNKLFFSNF